MKLETKEDSFLYLTDETGTPVSLDYQGTMEVRRYAGGYCVVNELSLEDYLTAVVPSEMPASYEPEALRAQAICARTYACMQLQRTEYAGFAANVDDTTNYQVYNKQQRDARSTQAVLDTNGQVMYYKGEIIEAYYYSNSCGFSQSGDVWNLDGDYGYLQSVSLLTGEEQPDISQEEGFAAFIRSTDYTGYDSDNSLFRWKILLDMEGRREAVNQAIAARRQISKTGVFILDKDGKETDAELSSLGKIQQMQVMERSSGGSLRSLRIIYEKGSVQLCTEYNIRKVLGAALVSATDKSGTAMNGLSMLPSAAFIIIPVEDGFVLYGGGSGHGIGMSQNGANGMAKAGMNCQDILQKFYQDITIENIYQNN